MDAEFRVSLEGPDARLGIVRAADVARVLLSAQRAMARGCGHVVGQPVKATGRWGRVIEQAVDLRLVAIEAGSLVHVLSIPAAPIPHDALQLESPSLGHMGADVALSAVGESAIEYPDVAQVWINLARDLELGARYQTVRLTYRDAEEFREAQLDEATAGRLRVAVAEAKQLAVRSETVVGVLVEADFEAMTARLRTPVGDRVTVSFEADLADDIQEALRHQTALLGEVRYHRDSAVARSVRLRTILSGEQLELPPLAALAPDFWRSRSIQQLAHEQGVRRHWSLDDLVPPDLTDEELASFLEALRS